MSTTDRPTSPENPEPEAPVPRAAAEPAGEPFGPPRPPKPLAETSEILRLMRYLYNHNPFYPISAVLILLGLHRVFHDAESARNITAINFNSGVLMSVVAGYAAVLATIVCLIVRLGKVWDDARTILLTLVLLLVTLSINGDKPILMHAGAASWFLIGGLIFSLGLCEVVLRATGIWLPWLLRGPFYLFLALFFLYPVGLDYCLHTIGDTQNALGHRLTLLGVLLFPTVAGAVGLMLLPAAIRGPAVNAGNRTPWTWPLYPWSLFVILAVAVVLRAFYLTVSFHPRAGMDSAFHIYFLTPFLLVVAAILFELGKSAGRVGLQQTALGAALLLLPLSLPGFPWAGPAADFMNLHRELFGAPVQVACVGVAILLTYAAWRNGPSWSGELAPFVIVLSAFTRNDTLHLNSFHEPAWQPLAIAATIMAARAALLPASSFRWTVTATFAVGALTIGFRDTPFTAYRGAIPVHLLLIAFTLISLIFHDRFTPFLRRVLAIVYIGFAFGIVTYAAQSMYAPSPGVTLSYVGVLAAATWFVWGALRGADELTAAVLVSFAAATQVGLMLATAVRDSSSPQGIMLLLCGIASLIIGTAISGLKVRVAQRQATDL